MYHDFSPKKVVIFLEGVPVYSNFIWVDELTEEDKDECFYFPLFSKKFSEQFILQL